VSCVLEEEKRSIYREIEWLVPHSTKLTYHNVSIALRRR